MSAFKGPGQFLTIAEKGFGKRTDVDRYPRHGRGGQGVINFDVVPKSGMVINTCHVQAGASVMLITANGKLIQLQTDDIRDTQSRAAVGVKCIDIEEGDYVASVTVAAGEVESVEENAGNLD